MRINRLNMNLNALKQRTSDLFSLLRINGEIIRNNENKRVLILIDSQFILTMRINNKYIIISYLNGLFSRNMGYYHIFGDNKDNGAYKWLSNIHPVKEE